MATSLQLMLLISVTICSTVVQGAPLAADTLFQVDFSGNANGGCLRFGRDKANRFLAEAQIMAQLGEQLADDYGSKDEATRLINAFVGELNGGEVRRLKCMSNFPPKFSFYQAPTLTF